MKNVVKTQPVPRSFEGLFLLSNILIPKFIRTGTVRIAVIIEAVFSNAKLSKPVHQQADSQSPKPLIRIDTRIESIKLLILTNFSTCILISNIKINHFTNSNITVSLHHIAYRTDPNVLSVKFDEVTIHNPHSRSTRRSNWMPYI